jgi:hypothetical protein
MDIIVTGMLLALGFYLLPIIITLGLAIIIGIGTFISSIFGGK